MHIVWDVAHQEANPQYRQPGTMQGMTSNLQSTVLNPAIGETPATSIACNPMYWSCDSIYCQSASVQTITGTQLISTMCGTEFTRSSTMPPTPGFGACFCYLPTFSPVRMVPKTTITSLKGKRSNHINCKCSNGINAA